VGKEVGAGVGLHVIRPLAWHEHVVVLAHTLETNGHLL
jgi:hypothetical protein